MDIIDAHQHFWQRSQPFNYAWLDNPKLAKINRDYLPEHLEPLLRACGVQRSVFVQTQHNVAENRWVLSLAERSEFIAGVVGWVDLASPECERQLLEFKHHPKFVGIRHVTQDEPDDNFIVRPEGGLVRRHGTRFLGEARSVGGRVRLVPFVFSTQQAYMLEFGDRYMRVWKDNAPVTWPAVPVRGISQSAPPRVSAPGHGLAHGDRLLLAGLGDSAKQQLLPLEA